MNEEKAPETQNSETKELTQKQKIIQKIDETIKDLDETVFSLEENIQKMEFERGDNSFHYYGLLTKWNDTVLLTDKDSNRLLKTQKIPLILKKASSILQGLNDVKRLINKNKIEDSMLLLNDTLKAYYEFKIKVPVFKKATEIAYKKKGKTKPRPKDEDIRLYMQNLISAGKQYFKEVLPETAKKFKVKQRYLKEKFPKKSFN